MMKDNKPNLHFIGVGAFKSATTFLSQILTDHPETCIAIGKEVHYFNKYFGLKRENPNFSKSLSWFASHFSHCEEFSKIGEISPMYLFDKEAPKKIKELYPNIKIIICLRHPVERAFSHFLMEYKTEKRDFDITFSEVMETNEFIMQAGLYYDQVKRYLKYFDKSQIHFIFSEDLEEKKEETLSSLYQFLEIKNIIAEKSFNNTDKVNSFRVGKFLFIERLISAVYRVNKFLRRKRLIKDDYLYRFMNTPFMKWIKEVNSDYSYPELEPEIRNKALKYYKDDVEKLEKLLNKDLSHWKV